MRHHILSTHSLVLLGLLSSSAVAAITKCPITETSIITSSGAKWAVCPNADYQADTAKMVTGITSRTACTSLCDQYVGCTKAVYDKVNYECHLKGDPKPAAVVWATNAQYETIRFVSKPAQGSAVTSCPNAARNVSAPDGALFSLCPNTNFQGTTAKNVTKVATEDACASLCSNTTGCTQAAYDVAGLVCQIKSSTPTAAWVFDTRSTTLRFLSRPAQGQAIASCPYGDQNVTSSAGLGFAICPKSDYQADTVTLLTNVASAAECANSCGLQKQCTKAVYDAAALNCHIKGNLSDATAAWTYNTQYTTVRLVNGTAASAGGPAQQGKWSAVINLPVIPVGAFVVPEQPESRRLLVFSSWGAQDFSGPTGVTQFADFNYVTGAVSAREVANTNHDMFCPAISSLADGRIVISGGENAAATSFYDPVTNNFTTGPLMNIPRGYQTSTTLSDGRIFTLGGSFTGDLGGKTGEVFDPVKNTWTVLSGANPVPILTKDVEGVYREDNHAWLFGWSGGSVFQAGPSGKMNWYGTAGTGGVVAAGVRNATGDAMCGVNVMYDAGKIFSAGGSQDYTDSPATASANLITITKPNVAATVERLPDMKWARAFANAVALPDGKVLVTGGQVRALVFTDVQSVLAAELWDPATKKFTVLAPQTTGRNYHSVSLLLADGTVFSGGGGMCPVAYLADDSFCDRTHDHPNGEIFSPPYLFNADGSAAARPVIAALASPASTTGLTAAVGSTLTVTLGDAAATGTTFALIRMGSATHSINSDQRRLSMTQVTQNKAVYTIKLPTDAGVLIPGYYFLFALNNKGVPSIAKTIRIQL